MGFIYIIVISARAETRRTIPDGGQLWVVLKSVIGAADMPVSKTASDADFTERRRK